MRHLAQRSCFSSLVSTAFIFRQYCITMLHSHKARTWLSKFFSRIMATHSIPKMWKKAKVIAVEKPGKDPSLAANYCPISLLSVCYKLLGRLALQHISPTVEGLLTPDQSGFRKSRRTCDQVAALTTFNENGFQQNLTTGAVFLDLTAAYDTVWHTGLLYKLGKRHAILVHPTGGSDASTSTFRGAHRQRHQFLETQT